MSDDMFNLPEVEPHDRKAEERGMRMLHAALLVVLLVFLALMCLNQYAYTQAIGSCGAV